MDVKARATARQNLIVGILLATTSKIIQPWPAIRISLHPLLDNFQVVTTDLRQEGEIFRLNRHPGIWR